VKEVVKYELKNDNNVWLGDIVLAKGGMFASVTDWGNFSFSWCRYSELEEFKEFLLSINTGYFADKMVQGFAYIATSKKIDAGAKRFAEKILPALQKAIKSEK
jgi:hypothetical protein